jgi:hypothetical protein
MIEALALAAAVQAATLPRYRVNDAFVFSDGRVERITRIQGSRITWRGLGGSPYVRSRNFAAPVLDWRSGKGVGSRRIVGTPDQLWPLDRPRSVRFRAIAETKVKPDAASRRAVTLWTCKTMKPRSVSIALGQFDTIPFSCDRYSATSMRLIERLEWDYAPGLNHYIRRSSVDYFRGTRSTIELVAALSGPGASRGRLAALSRSARQKSAVAARSGTGTR